jgi:hypothetical protein
VSGTCQVIGNTCDQNNQANSGGGGIRALGDANRIEGNSCTSAGAGFGISLYTNTRNNLVIRNSAHGNGTNYSFDVGNRYGTIVDLTAFNPNPVSGNSAASAAGTSDPWANFAY